jgi:precorrin-6B methylase 2
MSTRRAFCHILATVPSLMLAPAQTPRSKSEPDVPFLPSTEEAVRAMLSLAEVKRTDIVYDLGCGDGRIVIAAARVYGAHGVGIDINPLRIREARENAKKAGVDELVRFEENNLFRADIHEATVVTLFLLSSVNVRLRPKLLAELKPGTRIISNTFNMGDWKPDKQATVGDLTREPSFSHQLFLWIVPRPQRHR